MQHILMIKAIILQLHLDVFIGWLDLRGNMHVSSTCLYIKFSCMICFNAQNTSKNLFLRNSSKKFVNENIQIQNYQYRAKYKVTIV